MRTPPPRRPPRISAFVGLPLSFAALSDRCSEDLLADGSAARAPGRVSDETKQFRSKRWRSISCAICRRPQARSRRRRRLARTAAPTVSAPPGATTGAAEGDWRSYNKTLTSELNQINRDNVGKLKILCTYDTGQYTGFTSGLLEVNGALIFVTEYDIFSIDPATCRESRGIYPASIVPRRTILLYWDKT